MGKWKWPMKETVYLIVMVEVQKLTHEDDPKDIKLPSLEPIAACKDLETALEYVLKLEEMTGTTDTMFDVFEFELDAKPLMLDLLEKQQKDIEKAISQSIVDLMKEGMVDQLVGEDGNFYYTLTDLGKKAGDNLPVKIKKFFKRKDK